MRTKQLRILLRACCLLLATLSLAQSAAPPNQITSFNDTGVQPAGSYSGVLEDVNLANLNLNVEIPLLKLPGRNGHDVALTLQYDSKNWNLWGFYDPGTDTTEYGWTTEFRGIPVGGLGWRLNLPFLSGLDPIQDSGAYIIDYTDFIVTLADGSKHALGSRTEVMDSEDGSFLRIDGTYKWGGGDILVRTKSGTTIHFNNPSNILFHFIPTIANKIVDANGNVITLATDPNTGSITITDTLQRTVTVVMTGGQPSQVTYKDSNGSSQAIGLYYTATTLHPVFSHPQPSSSCSGGVCGPVVIVHQPGTLTYQMLTSVQLPTLETYQLEYNDFGELSKIMYPTGGYTIYDYQASLQPNPFWWLTSDLSGLTDSRDLFRVCTSPPDPCTNLDTAPITKYERVAPGIKVTDPEGNVKQYAFSPEGDGPDSKYFIPRETDRWIYSGASTLLRTFHTDYNIVDPNEPANYLPIRVTTTLNDTGGTPLVSKEEFDYDLATEVVLAPPNNNRQYQTVQTVTRYIDNVIEHRVYDYGLGSPGNLLRKTNYGWLKTNPVNSVDYAQTAIHILDRKSYEQVWDGATKVSQTEYEYDNYSNGAGHATISGTSAIGHDTAFSSSYTTRGNLTATTRWNDSGASLTTYQQFDDTGNVVKVLDTLLHPTTFSYTGPFDNTTCLTKDAYAYATSITNASSQTDSAKYNSCTGTVASITDKNGRTTQFTYDAIGRKLTTVYPDQGQSITTYAHAAPYYITSQVSRSDTAYVVNRTTLDGLGRVQRTELCEDGQTACAQSIKTDITYWGSGLRKTVTNPYRTTSDSTYGITQYFYDGLGRIRLTVPADGTTSTNNVTTSCSGNVTTVTDQSGRQKKMYTDALGRLTRVDEPGVSAHQ